MKNIPPNEKYEWNIAKWVSKGKFRLNILSTEDSFDRVFHKGEFPDDPEYSGFPIFRNLYASSLAFKSRWFKILHSLLFRVLISLTHLHGLSHFFKTSTHYLGS